MELSIHHVKSVRVWRAPSVPNHVSLYVNPTEDNDEGEFAFSLFFSSKDQADKFAAALESV